ncbi:hypothetical protein TNCV_666411 [Trichonephila clavipes]|uniref:Uncharacterized protein n=1 Tax=Trichonephila clavipes TaxID=2585209 RepID=A0A8X6SG65_TRICX|nr:hypothetical protein TNCV_666411 [Trichonephila clavipes]
MCIKLKNDIPVCQRTRRLSCSDNPSPMKSKYRRFLQCSGKSPSRFDQTSRTLQRKISMRSTKDQLVKKRRSYACETQCFPVEPSGCRRGAFT